MSHLRMDADLAVVIMAAHRIVSRAYADPVTEREVALWLITTLKNPKAGVIEKTMAALATLGDIMIAELDKEELADAKPTGDLN